MFDVIFEVIFDKTLSFVLGYPGAAIRWFISRFWKSKKTFGEIVSSNENSNKLIGLLFIGGIIALFYIR